MKNWFLLATTLIFITGCASTPSQSPKVVVWEAKDVSKVHEVIGPVSVSAQVTESTEDMIQGLAGFIGKDGRVADQIPSEMKAALEVKREKYKEMIYDKLANKAKEYGADAIIAAEYMYVPPYASFSSKATVTAKGTMIKYK